MHYTYADMGHYSGQHTLIIPSHSGVISQINAAILNLFQNLSQWEM